MKSASVVLGILFIVISLSSPIRFAYASANNTSKDQLASMVDVVGNLVSALTPSIPLHNLPPRTAPHVRAAVRNASSAQFVSSIVTTTRTTLSSAAAAAQMAAQSAGKTISHVLSQSASVFSAWIALANEDIVASIDKQKSSASGSMVVAPATANAPPQSAKLATSVFPTPHVVRA